jgi:hypothetical protein
LRGATELSEWLFGPTRDRLVVAAKPDQRFASTKQNII